ncbi:MAG: hypothetical protein LBM39_02735, partial [Candidatus Methanoplasma sp.]|nr:hypothetical protein [Candidatus Methanoplasma sp.]
MKAMKRRSYAVAVVSILAVLMMLAVPLAAVFSSDTYVSGATTGGTLEYKTNGGAWDVPTGYGYPDPAGILPNDAGDQIEVRFDPIPERQGYAFLGWDTNSAATDPKYKVTNPYALDTPTTPGRFFIIGVDPVVLHAIWKQADVTIQNSNVNGTGVENQNNSNDNGTVVISYSGGAYHLKGTIGLTYNGSPVTDTTDIGNIIRFNGVFANYRQIAIASTAPYGSADQLHIILDTVTLSRPGSSDTNNLKNLIDIRGNSSVEIQAYGETNAQHNASIAAMIRVDQSANFIYSGQGDSRLVMNRSTNYADSPGPAIGSQGNTGETPGQLQFETGLIDITWVNTNDGLRAAVIGGGGRTTNSTNLDGSNGGNITIRGGAIDIKMSSPYMTGTGIGGGGTADGKGGSGGNIWISGGHIRIAQTATSNVMRGTAIGGGSAYNGGTGGDSGNIKISGGDIVIYQTTNGTNIYGAAIGAAGAHNSNSSRSGGQADGAGNSIEISGGSIQIERVHGSGDSVGAFIGGGAGSGDVGTGAKITISGGTILLKGTTTSGEIRGAAIGGGGGSNRSGHYVDIDISGGLIDIRINSSYSSNRLYGAGIGGSGYSNSAGQTATVKITGGTISVERTYGSGNTPSTVQDIGNGGSASSPVTVDGGSISVLSTGGVLPNPKDSQGHPVFKTNVDLGSGTIAMSVFVKKTVFISDEFNVTRYEDFHVSSKNIQSTTGMSVSTTGSGSSRITTITQTMNVSTYQDQLHLYLPAAPTDTPNEISVEVQSDGTVWYFTSNSTAHNQLAVRQETGVQFYRVYYRIGSKLRYEADIVHIKAGEPFDQTLRANNANMGGYVAPALLSYVEMYNGTTMGDLNPEYYTYAANDGEPLVSTFVSPGETSSYGNIEFEANSIYGRLAIIADAVERVDVTYTDNITYHDDPTIPAPRHIERVFGVGYQIKLGYDKTDDPWTQNGNPIATTDKPELTDAVWKSSWYWFVDWDLNGADRDTGYDYTIPTTSPSNVTVTSHWEYKLRVYVDTDAIGGGAGSGKVQYILDPAGTPISPTPAWADVPASGFVPMPLGSNLYLKAVADEGSIFIWWTGDIGGEENPNDDLQNIQDEKYVTAWFNTNAPGDNYTVTLTKSGGDGKVEYEQNSEWQVFPVSPKFLTVPAGTVLKVKATATQTSPVNAFSYWDGDITGTGNPQDLTVNSDKNIAAYFTNGANDHTLTIATAGGDGHVTVSIAGSTPFTYDNPITVSHNTSVSLTAVADGASNAFSVWSVDLTGNTNPATVIVNTDKNITANFTNGTNDHTLTIATAGGAGHVTVNVNSTGSFTYVTPVTVSHNTSVALGAVAGALNAFSYWSGSIASNVNPVSFTVDENKNITANFTDGTNDRILTIAVDGAAGNHVDVTLGGTTTFTYSIPLTVSDGTSVDLEAIAVAGSTFLRWTGDITTDSDTTRTVVMDQNRNITAKFTTGTVYTIDVDKNGGNVKVQINSEPEFDYAGTLIVAAGENVTLTASKAVGQFSYWSGTDANNNNPWTITSVAKNYNVKAIFTDGVDDRILTISIAGGPGHVDVEIGGTIFTYTVGKPLTVSDNTNIGLEAVKDGASNSFSYWSQDIGSSKNPESVLMDADKNITANFTDGVNDRVVTLATAGGPGHVDVTLGGTTTFTYTDPFKVSNGSVVGLNAIGDYIPSNVLSFWSGDLTGNTNPTTVTVNANKNITANFTLNNNYRTLNVTIAGGPGHVDVKIGTTTFTYTGPVHVDNGTVVELTAVATGTTNSFSFWSQDLAGNTNPSGITVSGGDKNVTANFTDGSNDRTLTLAVTGGVVADRIDVTLAGTTFAYSAPLILSNGTSAGLLAVEGGGSTFIEWVGDSAYEGPGLSRTVTVDHNVSLTAVFTTASTYTLTIDVNGGSVMVKIGTSSAHLYTIPETVPNGFTVVITATAPTSGGQFSYWSGTEAGSDNPFTFIMDKTENIKANYTDGLNDRTLTVVTAGGDGEVNITIDGTTFTYTNPFKVSNGKSVTLNAIATGTLTNSFSFWSQDIKGNTNPASLVMNADKTVTANFTDGLNDHILTLATAGGPGHVQVKIGTTEFTYSAPITVSNNTDVELNAIGDNSNVLSYWSGDLTGNTNPTTVKVDSDKSITANFTADGTYLTLTVSTAGGTGKAVVKIGTTTFDYTDPVHVNAGTSVTLTAVATGTPTNAFSYWSGDIKGTTNPSGILIDTDKSVTANFTDGINDRTLTLATAGGMASDHVDVTLGTTTFTYTAPIILSNGVTAGLKAVAGVGSTFIEWTGEITNPGNGDTRTVILDQNRSIVANFTTADTHILTVDTSGGTVAVQIGTGPVYNYTSPVTVPNGAKVTLTASKAVGQFSYWSGTDANNHNPWVITSVTKSYDVKANFTDGVNDHTVTLAIAGGPGHVDVTLGGTTTFTYSNPILVSHNDIVGLNAIGGYPGNVLSYWSGDLTGNTNPTTITVNADKSIVAHFTQTSGYRTLTVATAGGSGHVDVNIGTTTFTYTGPVYVDNGTTVTLTAVRDGTNAFSYWSQDIKGNTNPSDITVSGGDKNVTANFTDGINDRTLTLSVTGGVASDRVDVTLGTTTFTYTA